VVGLNSLVITAEGVLGYFLFKSLGSIFKRLFWAGFFSTFLALFLSTLLALGIVALGTTDLSSAFGLGYKHPSKADKSLLKFESTEIEKHIEEPLPEFDFRKFLFLVLGFGFIGWTLEGLISGWILGYLHKVRPKIFEG